MNKTGIEWVRNPDGTQGYSWNPITGCLNGCPYCYARRLANGRLKARYLPNKNLPLIRSGLFRKPIISQDPFYPRFWAKRLGEPHNGKGKGIFVCDMSDLFGIDIPQDWTEQVMRIIKSCPQHRFYLLTKQPQNLIKFSPFPENCFVGVSVTGIEYMADAVANLACTKAKVRFMSFEPLLGSVMPKGLIDFLDLVIIGACSCTTLEELKRLNFELWAEKRLDLDPKPWGRRWTLQPKVEWVDAIILAADKAGVPVFLKNNLRPLLGDNLRQDVPK